MDKSLKTLLESIVEEELALLQTEAMRGGFDFNYFKTLTHPDTMYEYAFEFLTHLGTGSSRAVFALSSGKVLKIAYDMVDAGIAQNEAEVEISTNPKAKPVVARVFDAHDEYMWIVSELVKPVSSGDAVTTAIGISGSIFERLLSRMLGSRSLSYNDAVEEMAYNAKDKQALKQALSKVKVHVLEQLITGIKEMQRMVGLNVSDIVNRPEHFGQTADGRIVILDYGYNDAVGAKHYGDTWSQDSYWDVERDHIPSERYRRARKPNW